MMGKLKAEKRHRKSAFWKAKFDGFTEPPNLIAFYISLIGVAARFI